MGYRLLINREYWDYNPTNFLGHSSRIDAFHGKTDRLLVVLYNSHETWDTSGHPPVQQRSGRIFHHGFVKPPPVSVMFIYTWYPNQPFFIGCFSWITPTYIRKNDRFTISIHQKNVVQSSRQETTSSKRGSRKTSAKYGLKNWSWKT